MIDEIYNEKVIAYAARIGRLGRLDKPDATAEKYSDLCGSKVTVDIKIADGIVCDYAHQVKACVLGQASSAIMAELIIGTTTTELRMLRQNMIDMLENGGRAPSGKFAAFACLYPVRNYKPRQRSTMLVFDAVDDCINQVEKNETKRYS